MAYEQINPEGAERADLRNALLICAIETLFREAGFGSERSRWIVEDFLPYMDPQEREWAREDYECEIAWQQQQLMQEQARLNGLME